MKGKKWVSLFLLLVSCVNIYGWATLGNSWMLPVGVLFFGLSMLIGMGLQDEEK